MKSKSVIYLSYDGLLDHLGQSQIVPYIVNLDEKIDYTIISLEKKELLNSKLHKNLKYYFYKKKINWIKLR